jgi:hypothetical protein
VHVDTVSRMEKVIADDLPWIAEQYLKAVRETAKEGS